MTFLGHVVSKDGIQVDPKKIEAIIEWPRPTTVIEEKFFGLSKLLYEICEGFLQVNSACDQADSKNYQVIRLTDEEHFQLL